MKVVDINSVNISRSQHSGFTLIEMMVSLAVLSMLILLLYNGFHFTTVVSERVDKQLDGIGGLTLAQQFIRRQIGQAEVLKYRNDRGELIVMFEGEQDRLNFISSMPNNEYHGGLHRFTLMVNDNEAGQRQLVVQVRRYNEEDDWYRDDDNDVETVVLYDDFENAAFSYLGEDRAQIDPWQSKWVGSENFPQAVRIEIRDHADEHIVWPTLVVSPKAGHYQALQVRR